MREGSTQMRGVYTHTPSSAVYLSLLECKAEAASECRDGASPCQTEKAQSSSAIGIVCAPRLPCSWSALKQKQIALQP